MTAFMFTFLFLFLALFIIVVLQNLSLSRDRYDETLKQTALLEEMRNSLKTSTQDSL
jgi:ABC-type sulfate transport system permease component